MEKMFETQQEFLGSDKNGKIIVNKLFNFYIKGMRKHYRIKKY